MSNRRNRCQTRTKIKLKHEAEDKSDEETILITGIGRLKLSQGSRPSDSTLMWIIHKFLWITVWCFSLVVEDASSTSLEWNKKPLRYHRVPIRRWASIGGHFHSFDLWPQFSSSVIPARAVHPHGCQWITRQFPVSAFTTECTGGFWVNTTSVTPFQVLRDRQRGQARRLSGSKDWHVASKEGESSRSKEEMTQCCFLCNYVISLVKWPTAGWLTVVASWSSFTIPACDEHLGRTLHKTWTKQRGCWNPPGYWTQGSKPGKPGRLITLAKSVVWFRRALKHRNSNPGLKDWMDGWMDGFKN